MKSVRVQSGATLLITFINLLVTFINPGQKHRGFSLRVKLALAIVAPSLVALTVRSCDDSSLSLKGWGLEYQLTKKGSCSPTPEITQK
jgi:hypothetical protein